MENKVKFNIKNVHVALITEEEDQSIKFGTPEHIPGAVSLSLSANGEMSRFWADGIAYYVTSANNGYEGDLEMALIPSWFRERYLNEEKDSNGVLVENANNMSKKFALLFEFDGDQKSIRRCMYNCTCTRPSIEGQTTEDTKEPGTETLTISSTPLADGTVKAQTGPDTDKTAYDNWYKSVYTPATETEGGSENVDEGN